MSIKLTLVGACLAAAMTSATLGAQNGQFLRSRGLARKCIEVAGGKHDPGTALQLADCLNADDQRFTYVYDEKDVQSAGEIRLFGGTACVTANGNTPGRPLAIGRCANSRDFIWLRAADGPEPDAVTIRNAYTGLCVDIPTGSLGKTTAIVLGTCNGSASQKWDWVATPASVVDAVSRQAAAQASPATLSKEPPRAATPSARSVSVQSVSAPAVIRKLYVLDGTQVKAKDHDAVWQVWDAWHDHAQYWEGPDMLGSNMQQLYDLAYSAICNDVRNKTVTQAFIIGYSRGAVASIKLANQTRRNCGAKVQFLGLVDAVNTLNYDWPTSIDPGIPVSIHIRKQADWEHVLTTATLAGITTIKHPQFAWHHAMVCSDKQTAWMWTRDQIMSYAKQAGGVFDSYSRRNTDCG